MLDLVRALLCCKRASRDSILIVAAGVPNMEHVGGGSSFRNQKGALVAAEGSRATLTAIDGALRSLLSLLPKAAGRVSGRKTWLLPGLSPRLLQPPAPHHFFGCIRAPGLLCRASKASARHTSNRGEPGEFPCARSSCKADQTRPGREACC